ncbi:MAG: hypothetical protein M1825_004067 [Sarcosagium campestre]|nr:MAG: hypothetical protein M1825_004067 [Sarcosagium campestre]
MMSPSQDIPWLLDPVAIESSDIPDGPNVDIRESTYFQKWEKLPATQEVRSAAAVKHSAAHPDIPLSPDLYGKPPFVTFEDQNLFVKWGTRALISEGQCLFAIHRHFGAAVPVPEVYGWRMEGAVVYIFMEFIRGQTLDSAWDTLEADGRTSICLQLRTIFHNLRLGKQDDQTPLIG